jgi:S1-C subfamily serine protease
MLKGNEKDLQERLERMFPGYDRRERETTEMLRQLSAGEIKNQIPSQKKWHVEKAVVRLENPGGGLGTLVPGGIILTATHCIRWDGRGRMALGAQSSEWVGTPAGSRFRVRVAACDPLSDMAALQALEYEESDDKDVFERWQECVTPIPLSTVILELNESRPVWIFTHTGQWLTGVIMHCGLPITPQTGTWYLATKEPIEGGTSGAPVVDADGKLIGVVSQTWSVGGKDSAAPVPIPRLALPSWLLARVTQEWNQRERGLR